MDDIKIIRDEDLDAFSYHEMLDRSFIILSQMQDLLIDHQVAHAHPEIANKLQEAHAIIWSVYQAMGTVEISEE